MNLNCTQDIILLRNCIVIKKQELKLKINELGADSSSIQQSLDNYMKILDHLNNNNPENAIDLLHNYADKDEEISNFSKHISEISPQDLAQEYLNLMKKIMETHGAYSDKKFKELKSAFYKGNEDLNSYSTNYKNFEEEPENSTSENITENMQNYLSKLDMLIQQNNPKKMTTSDFKDFLLNFKETVKTLGMNKFQQYFDKQSQTITDMQISYDTNIATRPVYKTDFTLLDNNSQETHLSVYENATQSGFTSRYHQNLCYTYLEADKYSKLDDSFITSELISTKMSDFLERSEKIKEMMSQCAINIRNHSIVPSDASNFESTLSLEEKEKNDEVIEI